MSGTTDAGVGGSIHPDNLTGSAAKGAGTQDAPAMDINETTTDARIDGIVAQSRTDVDVTDVAAVELLLSRRLSDAGIDMTVDQISELARRVGDDRDGA